ncbi:MAG: Fe-S metabolism protein SufE [Euryarchaeota archaeon]|jgi:cysteine desulfuration protein SufE|nr:Fe-S metabolism protein SufE [Euryarchaeota archaeon]
MIKANIEKYKEQLDMFSDHFERYQYMMDCGKNATPFPEEFRIADFKVPGCVSQVWLVPKFENGIVTYMSDSDAFITKGTVTILCDVFSGHTPKEIVDNEIDVTRELNFGNTLTAQRRNGAYNMIIKIKEYAEKCL